FSSAANQIVVTGTNSVWTGGDNLSVGEGGSRNLLVVSNAGFYGGGNVIVGELSSSTNNRVVVDGGTLRVTNATGTGFLDVRRGTNVLNAGLIDVGQLLLTNTQGFFEFKGGTLVTRGAVISNGASFVVGTFGLLAVENGGLVTDDIGYIGLADASSNNTALVTGPGSLWSNAGALFIGNAGVGNRLIVSDGGVVRNGSAILGNFSSANQL